MCNVYICVCIYIYIYILMYLYLPVELEGLCCELEGLAVFVDSCQDDLLVSFERVGRELQGIALNRVISGSL